MSLSNMLLPPSWVHPLGTDNLGRDFLVRCAEAMRYAVLPLWGGVLLATVIGFLLGAACLQMRQTRYLGWFSAGLQTVATLMASIPVGIAVFAWAVLSENAGIWPVLLAVSTLFAVRVFLQTLDLFRHDLNLNYWEAHRAMGGTLLHRIFVYGLFGTWKWRLLDGLGFHLRAAVAIEASLSYLGFGIQEPTPSFGNMLASHFDMYLKGEFYSLLVVVGMLALTAAFPGSFLSLLKSLVNPFTVRNRQKSRELLDFDNLLVSQKRN